MWHCGCAQRSETCLHKKRRWTYLQHLGLQFWWIERHWWERDLQLDTETQSCKMGRCRWNDQYIVSTHTQRLFGRREIETPWERHSVNTFFATLYVGKESIARILHCEYVDFKLIPHMPNEGKWHAKIFGVTMEKEDNHSSPRRGKPQTGNTVMFTTETECVLLN